MSRKRKMITETDEAEFEPTEPQHVGKETCMNPWNGRCGSTDIALYIMYKGDRLPICRECWEAISSKDVEWKYD